MKRIEGQQQLYYIEHNTIQSFFSFDISPYIEVFEFDKGDFIIQEGAEPEYLFYMVEGKAKLYVTHKNGKVSLINFLTPPIFMGEIELLNEEKYSKSIQTSSRSICIGIAIEKCKEKLLADAHFLKYLCIFLSNKSTVHSAKYTKHQAYPLENKLAEFILLSSHHDIYKEKHTEISDYFGVSYRHLLHTFAQLADAGIIEKTKMGYKIKSKEKLQALADEIK
ncbi:MULTISPECIES: transcriptional regulator YeiL [Psychrobacillus]|uniref:transcriptional regulator YeiL n=1 Tax=Psychrobacillus TaxID=1221880 RepID=UPI0008E3BE05|nr:transcriptional regulator YeiL [Psychrobacillus psychrodurans]MCZ8541713.1 transcriptional regulator YeiL [Psychrobacillus psychrodurans]SFN08492.1 cAMP-binding domain of CRP or a regulatory subunit of cAMP-dependent protein kinases [Psychrobacillus psychrodurans]